MILVSACLLGVNCKYDGENNINQAVKRYLRGKAWVPVCPEQLGGLPTPRESAEIRGGSGREVLEGKARVACNTGEDVTRCFIRGARESLWLAEMTGAGEALLKARSPSCGSGEIYDGSFQGRLREGEGVTAALLRVQGITVYSEEDL